ncbi:hypothetical protein PVAND_012233 [Polypedilum vanderplanki]|uniref:Inosine/uridine-preferring nucleoside hydrolase domain-containing protein n=1 Tax=Polypedilum vanderplanki TaxID=319348 RepID=A0A9J6CMR4_POLVA|nr:hypothetical protein PVAND_012233 [Polypedilum vanderplanki]
MSKAKVIFDTDAGTDDAWALITLLRCEEKYNIELKAITVVSGNTNVKHGCQNILLILKTMNRLDIPVYAGAADSLLFHSYFKHGHYHGMDGLKDVFRPEEKPSLDLVQKKHAIEGLRALIEENPNEITIFAVGPLTNIALLYKMYPEISTKIKNLYIMGGNHQGIGNSSRTAEFNFHFDPESARIVLDESKCSVLILPWEPCLKACFATPHKEWRFKVLNSINNEIIEFMDKIEIDVQFRKSFCPCDAYLVCCFIFPKMIKKVSEFNVNIELSGEFTRGQMVLDHKLLMKPNATIIEEFDVEMFKKILLWVCGHEIDI